MVLALDGTAVLVDLGDGDLDGRMVLGLDDAVGGAALARDVTVWNRRLARVPRPSFLVSEFEGGPYRSTISPLSFSIVAAVMWCCLKERCGLRRLEERYRKFGWSWVGKWGFAKLRNFGGSKLTGLGCCRSKWGCCSAIT